jgi:hypothetical protein
VETPPSSDGLKHHNVSDQGDEVSQPIRVDKTDAAIKKSTDGLEHLI